MNFSFYFLLLLVILTLFVVSCSYEEIDEDLSSTQVQTTTSDSFFSQDSTITSSTKGIHDGSCPYGIHDDPAPGSCRFYVDTDADHICDRSLE